MTDLDLFGNPVDQPAPAAAPAAAPWVNDMDLVQTVLADVLDEKVAALHRTDGGEVTRCRVHGTAPVADEEAVVVNQLIAARYLTTTRRHHHCTDADHGPAVTTTPAGRSACYRWNAYQRPASWGPCGGQLDVERGDHGGHEVNEPAGGGGR